MTNITIKTDQAATEDATTDSAVTDKKSLTDMLHSDEMSLDDKLKAIEAAMESAQVQANKASANGAAAPVDPSLLTMCDSCQ